MEDSDVRALMDSVRLHSGEPKIGSAPVRFEYVQAPLVVWPTVNATEFLVAVAPKRYDRLAVFDVGRTLQKIVMDATRMGLATCWIGPGADHDSIVRGLGGRFDSEQDHIVCVCAVGYRSRFIPLFIRIFNAQMHRRLPVQSLFFRDSRFTVPVDLDDEPLRKYGRTYEICQWAPSSYNGQTTRCVVAAADDTTGRGGGPIRFDFFSATESRYYAPVAVGIWCANWELGCSHLGIRGHLAVLSDEERGVRKGENGSSAPVYEISWIEDETAGNE